MAEERLRKAEKSPTRDISAQAPTRTQRRLDQQATARDRHAEGEDGQPDSRLGQMRRNATSPGKNIFLTKKPLLASDIVICTNIFFYCTVCVRFDRIDTKFHRIGTKVPKRGNNKSQT